MTQGATLQAAVKTGVQEQWKHDLSLIMDLLTPAEPNRARYWATPQGDPPDPHLAAKVRKHGVGYFRQMLYRKGPARDGAHQVLGVRWVDVKKAGRKCRSRLKAKDIKTCGAPVFAATPPIESLKYLLGRATQDTANYIMHVEVTRADLYDAGSRDMYVKLPAANS